MNCWISGLSSLFILMGSGLVWSEPGSPGLDRGTEEWLTQLRGSLEGKTASSRADGLPRKRCSYRQTGMTDIPEKHSLLIFTSFSLEDSVWIRMAEEAGALRGIFVLNGLPNNSFVELSKRLLTLKKSGFDATVQIDPRLFEKYGIDRVPSYVVVEGEEYDKLSGCVSLDFALAKMAERGDTANAKNLSIERRGGK